MGVICQLRHQLGPDVRVTVDFETWEVTRRAAMQGFQPIPVQDDAPSAEDILNGTAVASDVEPRPWRSTASDPARASPPPEADDEVLGMQREHHAVQRLEWAQAARERMVRELAERRQQLMKEAEELKQEERKFTEDALKKKPLL